MTATREDVAREALTWVGTPYHHCADVKGAGVDCGMFLVRLFCDPPVELAPKFDPRPYKPQWYLHRDVELYLNWIKKYARPVQRPGVGDIEVFNFGRHAAHGAVYVTGNAIVHAFKFAEAVVKDDPRAFAGRHHSFWSAFV